MENYGYNNPEPNQFPGDPNNPNNPNNPFYRSDKKLAAGLLAILLGYLGIHKFFLGYNQEGVILLLSTIILIPILSIITCGLGISLYLVVGIIPLVEGIIYLTMSDAQFDQTYVHNKKPWF